LIYNCYFCVCLSWINNVKMNDKANLEDFNKLFSDYQGRFIRFASSFIRDPVVAEDITVDSFMYYWENRHLLPHETNIPAYILTTIKHKCLNYLEHIRVREEYAKEARAHAVWELSLRISTLEACEPKELFTQEIQNLVDKTLASLPEQSRRVFIMSRYENKSHKEIASVLKITVKGVEYHISKVLGLLRTVLKEYLYLFF